MVGGDVLSSVGDGETCTVGVGSDVTDGLLAAPGCVYSSAEAHDERSIINARMKGAIRLISSIPKC